MQHTVTTRPVTLIDKNGQGYEFTVDMNEEMWISDPFMVQGHECCSTHFTVNVYIYFGESSTSLDDARDKCLARLRKAGIPPKEA